MRVWLRSILVHVSWRTLLVILGARRRVLRGYTLHQTAVGCITLKTLPTLLDNPLPLNNGHYPSWLDVVR